MNGSNDTTTVRIVAIALAVLAGLALVLGAGLLWAGVDAASTAVIFTIGGTGVGGLASLLASTSQRPPTPPTFQTSAIPPADPVQPPAI